MNNLRFEHFYVFRSTILWILNRFIPTCDVVICICFNSIAFRSLYDRLRFSLLIQEEYIYIYILLEIVGF